MLRNAATILLLTGVIFSTPVQSYSQNQETEYLADYRAEDPAKFPENL